MERVIIENEKKNFSFEDPTQENNVYTKYQNFYSHLWFCFVIMYSINEFTFYIYIRFEIVFGITDIPTPKPYALAQTI